MITLYRLKEITIKYILSIFIFIFIIVCVLIGEFKSIDYALTEFLVLLFFFLMIIYAEIAPDE